jgi:hypothetical protein
MRCGHIFFWRFFGTFMALLVVLNTGADRELERQRADLQVENMIFDFLHRGFFRGQFSELHVDRRSDPDLECDVASLDVGPILVRPISRVSALVVPVHIDRPQNIPLDSQRARGSLIVRRKRPSRLYSERTRHAQRLMPIRRWAPAPPEDLGVRGQRSREHAFSEKACGIQNIATVARSLGEVC